MSKVGVALKIDVTKIDKNRLFAGQKGKYLDATVFVELNELDQYGNSGMITQDVSKDEKAQGVQGAILGNCKVFWSDSGNQQSQQQQAPQTNQSQYQQAPQQARQATNQAVQNNVQAPPTDYEDSIPF